MTAKKSNGNGRHQGRGVLSYTYYNFKDQDPIIDRVRTIVRDSRHSYGHIANESGVSASCLNAWFNGRTKCPRYATIMAVVRSQGYDLVMAPREFHASDDRPVKALEPKVVKVWPTTAQLTSMTALNRERAPT